MQTPSQTSASDDRHSSPGGTQRGPSTTEQSQGAGAAPSTAPFPAKTLLSQVCPAQRVDALVTKELALRHPKPTLCSLQTALAPSHLLLLRHLPWFLTPAWLRAGGKPCWVGHMSRLGVSAGSWGWRRKEGGRGRAGRYRRPEKSAGICWRRRVRSVCGQGPLASCPCVPLPLLQLGQPWGSCMGHRQPLPCQCRPRSQGGKCQQCRRWQEGLGAEDRRPRAFGFEWKWCPLGKRNREHQAVAAQTPRREGGKAAIPLLC